jgi:hypothetical protein
MIYSSFESSIQGDLNDDKIIVIAKILTALSLFKDINVLLIITESANWIPMIFTRLDSSHQEDSKDMCFISVALILTKLL